jgi:hypothetical protein
MGMKSSSDIFFIISVTAALMAVLSWALKPDTVWLAATQWLLISITVGVWGLYLRIRDMHEGNGKKK